MEAVKTEKPLAQQLRERMAAMQRSKPKGADCISGCDESRADYEKRIMETPEAWTGVGEKGRLV